MSGKKVVVIGAGIAGLSAGCYLQMNGYESEIYESHDISGGLCTSWERKGYIFDGCIHWLVGSSPAHSLYNIWFELGAIDKKTEIYDSEIFTRIEGKDGSHFTVFTNVDKLEAEMLRFSTKDEETIKEFTDAIRFFISFECSRDNPPPPEVQRTFGEKIPAFYQKWAAMPTKAFLENFTDTKLKFYLQKIFGDFVGDDAPIFFLLATLGYMSAKTAGYPIGGSRPFAERIEQRYVSLGGKIHFKAKVKEILVENDKTTGILLDNGKKILADIVISAADGYNTIFNMLGGKYIDDDIKWLYDNLKPFPPICQVSLGVADDFKDEPHSIAMPLQQAVTVDPKTELKEIGIRITNFDPTLASEGKTTIVMFFMSEDYEYWVDLRENDRKKYNKAKDQLANAIIDQLEHRFPNIKSKIEVIDVSTPATFIRYTGNWKGSYEGWLPDKKVMGKTITETLPGLSNFYMVGHWTRPGGGLPPAAMSAKKIVGLICKEDGKEFKTL
jgi:phytoene dehydrogenase-like protein